MKPKLKNMELYEDGKIYFLIEKKPLKHPKQELIHNEIISFLRDAGLKSKDNFLEIDIVFEENSTDYLHDKGYNYEIHLFNSDKHIHLIIDTSPLLVKNLIKEIKNHFEVDAR